MKIKTKELQKAVEMAFLPFGGEYFIEAPRLFIEEDKIYFHDSSLGSLCAGAIFDGIIIDGEGGEVEKIDLTSTLFDVIKRFRGKETIVSIKDDARIYINSAKDHANEPATEHNFLFANTKPHYVWNKHGFTPDKYEPTIQFVIDASNLRNLYKSDEYKFLATEEGTISVQLTYEGYTEIKKDLEPKEGGVFENKEIIVDADYFNSVLALMDGEVNISFDDIAICIYQEKENYKVSYFILCIKE